MRISLIVHIALASALPSLNGVLGTHRISSPGQHTIGNEPGGESHEDAREDEHWKPPSAMRDMLHALEVMQDTYFDIFTGTWPAAIDWTAAVIGTHVSASLSSIVAHIAPSSLASCSNLLSWQNIIDKYYAHTSVFYFGENAFAIRNQAYDDMLWVVLGWLENIKFAELFSHQHWEASSVLHEQGFGNRWHGLQFSPMAAHRARIFYDLASQGWDDSLCDGGMNWNPHLEPYKNAITNELYTAASIAMYLHFPGDNNSSPYYQSAEGDLGLGYGKSHDPVHLENAIKSYKWLVESHMQSQQTGLYQDGFHILGWKKYPNGTINPGTGKCNELNTMVFTYNQGVILTANRGLWIATGARSYLDEGHSLVESVTRATGWPNRDRRWRGLGRGGILEEYCDIQGTCSQDGQTFKSIFFLHLSEFCRPLSPHEEDFVSTQSTTGFDRGIYEYHLARCEAYGKWISHNAAAALATRNSEGLFGMWWIFDKPDDDDMTMIQESTKLPPGAEDYINPASDSGEFNEVQRGDLNDRGRGRTVETQAGGLSVLRAKWNWDHNFP
jgi:hypothetical protein